MAGPSCWKHQQDWPRVNREVVEGAVRQTATITETPSVILVSKCLAWKGTHRPCTRMLGWNWECILIFTSPLFRSKTDHIGHNDVPYQWVEAGLLEVVLAE